MKHDIPASDNKLTLGVYSAAEYGCMHWFLMGCAFALSILGVITFLVTRELGVIVALNAPFLGIIGFCFSTRGRAKRSARAKQN